MLVCRLAPTNVVAASLYSMPKLRESGVSGALDVPRRYAPLVMRGFECPNAPQGVATMLRVL